MGLTKRNDVWWMSFMYQGRQVRRSTGTSKKQLAEAIYAKVKVQIAEGQFFERREEQEHTFKEMMERYVAERATLKAAKSRLRDHAALGHLLPVLGERVLAHITPKVMAQYKAQRRSNERLQRPSTRSSSLSGMPSTWPCGNGNGAGKIRCTGSPWNR
jgi:hypothetical protein